MGVFDDIKQGMQEAIDYEKGKGRARVTKLQVVPTDIFTPSDIKAIRQGTGLTQALFAKYMGVSPKTVEAWESGRNHPEGAACRLLTLTQNDPLFPKRCGIIK